MIAGEDRDSQNKMDGWRKRKERSELKGTFFAGGQWMMPSHEGNELNQTSRESYRATEAHRGQQIKTD